MNNEKMNQMIDEAYENYVNKNDGVLGRDHLWTLKKEEFIYKCKTDSEFSKEWGLKIEERELSKSELNILYNIRRGVGKVDTNYSIGTVKSKDTSIPTRLITITYKNETIESYE